ncbi:hypothetical protein TCON_1125 [Astathelohania contejeani]|uniref:Uncharacterized protein n=1 Tax=Astathelohania contejeani TaxID=164912 RepID=A0ABQ7HZU0_9MICR|nr:hypothetical protein TCON_1125 [Thelohania contejeani]
MINLLMIILIKKNLTSYATSYSKNNNYYNDEMSYYESLINKATINNSLNLEFIYKIIDENFKIHGNHITDISDFQLKDDNIQYLENSNYSIEYEETRLDLDQDINNIGRYLYDSSGKNYENDRQNNNIKECIGSSMIPIYQENKLETLNLDHMEYINIRALDNELLGNSINLFNKCMIHIKKFVKIVKGSTNLIKNTLNYIEILALMNKYINDQLDSPSQYNELIRLYKEKSNNIISKFNGFIFLILPEFLSLLILIQEENFIIKSEFNIPFIFLLELMFAIYDCKNKIKLEKGGKYKTNKSYVYYHSPILIERKGKLRKIVLMMLDTFSDTNSYKELYIEITKLEILLEKRLSVKNLELIEKNIKICHLLFNVFFQLDTSSHSQIKNNIANIAIEIPRFEISYHTHSFYISVVYDYFYKIDIKHILLAYVKLQNNYKLIRKGNNFKRKTRYGLITTLQSKIANMYATGCYKNTIHYKTIEQILLDFFFLHDGYTTIRFDTLMLYGYRARNNILYRVNYIRKKLES